LAANPHSSPAVPDGTPQKRPSLWTRDFALVCLFNLAIFISFQMLMPTIPVYVDRLGGNQAVIGLVTGIFTVSSVALRPWTGLGLDRYGRRGIWLAGTLVFVLAVAGYNWALSIALLMMLRVVHGAGWGVLTVSAATAATDLVPPPRRGEGMGFFGLGANLGMAFGPAVGFAVVNRFGFPNLFWASAVLAALASLLIFVVRLPEVRRGQGAPPPALWEPTAVKPALLMSFATFIWGGVATFIALHAAEHGIANAGVYFTAYAVTLLLTRPTMGALFDRCGHRVVLVPGFLLLGISMVILGLADSLAAFLGAAVVGGLGFGSLHPALQALAVATCAPTRRGAAQATFTASFDLGIGVGAVALGLLAQFTGYGGMFLASAGMALAGLVTYLAVGVDGMPAGKRNVPPS